MTGDLSMGNHKLTDVANPENDGDAVNKQYVDAVKPYNLGRYIVFPYDEAKYYFSVRAKKNVDLDSGLQAEIKNYLADMNMNVYNNHPQDITINMANLELLPNPGKDLAKMVLNSPIGFNLQPFVMESWTLLVSEKPGDSPPFSYGPSSIVLSNGSPIRTMWRGQSLAYGVNNENYEVNLDTTELHHVAIVYNDSDNKLTFWVNG